METAGAGKVHAARQVKIFIQRRVGVLGTTLSPNEPREGRKQTTTRSFNLRDFEGGAVGRRREMRERKKTRRRVSPFLTCPPFWRDAQVVRYNPRAAGEPTNTPNLFQTLSRRLDNRADNRRQERKNWRSQGGSTPKAT